MSLNAKHPLYTHYTELWEQMTHTHEGEHVVKEHGTTYLPATPGMEIDGMGSGQDGYAAYQAYKLRAVYPSDVHDAVEGMVGVLHGKPPKIKVPKALEEMLKCMTPDGADAQTLLRRINMAQLLHGRLGLLLDAPKDAPAGTLPYVALYPAPSIINWTSRAHTDGKDKLAIVVLNETGDVMKPDLTWEEQEQYRVLATNVSVAELTLDEDEKNNVDLADENAIYQVGIGKADAELTALEWIEPTMRGNPMNEIPFVMVNTQDLSADPDQPPLLGLSNLCLAIYRGEADYRQALFLQGQETLVITGSEAGLDPESTQTERRMGAGAVLELPLQSTAAYVGASGAGLAEMANALDKLHDLASQAGMKILDSDEGMQASGDALRIRVAARTASLTSIARAGGAALETMLRHAATWLGANPDEVSVEPNLDFAKTEMTGDELAAWAAAKAQGAPISWRTIHDMLVKRGVTEMEYEEEQEEIAQEEPVPVPGADPNDPFAQGDIPPEEEDPPPEDV